MSPSHSSGSHLAACALSRGWREEGLPADFCKGALLISGMYDLEPVRLSKRSAYVKFTDEMEQALSAHAPYRRPDDAALVAHGTCETPEFQRQARDFFAAVKAAGKPAELIVGENYNHFEIFETLRQSLRPARPRHAAADGIELSQAASALLICPGLAAWLAEVRISSAPQLRQA